MKSDYFRLPKNMVTQYEELRSNIVEKKTNTAYGFAAFARHGMLAWGLSLKDHSQHNKNEKSDIND